MNGADIALVLVIYTVITATLGICCMTAIVYAEDADNVRRYVYWTFLWFIALPLYLMAAMYHETMELFRSK